MEKIFYSNHLKFRLGIRKIPYNLPREIYLSAKEHYFDSQTLKLIAIKKIEFKGKAREMAVTYKKQDGSVRLITIHPLKTFQKTNRIQSGRWQKL